MVGESLKKIMPAATYLSSKNYDLTKEEDVKKMYETYKPEIVIHLAAKVGGIMDNIKKPAEYFRDNILMNTFILDYAYKNNVKRFLTVLSTCIYPDMSKKYPIQENFLHDGPPTITNFSYGYSKRCMAVQIDAYNQQYNTKYQYLIPCNLYGEYDKYGENSHFIAALIKKIHTAKIKNENKIILFGSGNPLRQFMHSDDLAFVIKKCIEDNIYENMNVAINENLSIKEMAEIAIKAMDANNIEINFDTTKPDGQFRKDVSVDLLKKHIPEFNPIDLYQGIKKTYKNLLKNNLI